MAVLGVLVAAACAQPAAAQDYGGSPQQAAGALNRYYSSQTTTHIATPGPVPAGFAFEATLGFLLPAGGSGRHAIYGCRSGGADYFLSFDAGCEGTTSLGRYGFAYDAAPADVDTVAFYRCVRPGLDHFFSLDPGCEGFGNEGRMGFLPRRGDALVRSYNGAANRHVVTAAATPGGFGYEFTLGFLLPAGGSDRTAIYGCLAPGSDYFLSLDSGCEGRASLGREGYAYNVPPTSEETVAVYRCVVPGNDHFASNDPNCEGQRTEGRLGFLRLYGDALYQYVNPADGSLWATPGAPLAGYRYERTLGFLVRSGGPNLRAINGCRSGAADYFLSLDPGCETRTGLGRYGFAFTSPPANEPTVALYRCSRPGRGHFASLDANCEGVLQEGLLGYIRTLESGPPPPPSCAPSAGKIVANLRGRTSRTIRFGRAATLLGSAVRPDGSPAAGAEVLVLEGGGPLAEVGRTTAGPDGVFAFRIPAGHSRTLRAAYRAAPGDEALACSGTSALHVRAGVTLRSSPRRPRARRLVRFSGRVLGGPIPARGKLLVLQAFERGRWRTFKSARSDRRGGWVSRYRFTRSARGRSFRIRVVARREARYPYSLGWSRTIRVRVH
jgi:hypothetical protein